MTAANLDDYLWLTSEEGLAALHEVVGLTCGNGPVDVALAARLRKQHSAARTHLLLEQIDLRWRAREKFSRAAEMFFTRKGLEQATDELIARYKSRRFPAGEQVVDLCCGIGGDTFVLATRGPVAGFEADVITAHVARCNLRAMGFNSAVVRCERAVAAHVTDASGWHIDPDRRATGQRVVHLADYEPGPDFLRELLDANPNGAAKIAPVADFAAENWPACEREWLESRGECRQQLLWFGKLAEHAGHHTATVVSGSGLHHSFTGLPQQPFEYAEAIAAYVYEPASTLLAARLAGSFAAAHQLRAITSGGGYLTGDHLIEHPLSSAFRVSEVMPFDLKKLRAYCREHRLGQLEVKKRGVDIDPARVRKEVIADGENAAVVIVAPLAGSVKAIVAERLPAKFS